MRFDWDPAKDRINRKKHGLSFSEASELLQPGAEYLEIYDEAHSGDEDRFIAIGRIQRRAVVVAYAECEGGVVRIVSARPATRKERDRLEEYEETRR